jgi:hypothetical protein
MDETVLNGREESAWNFFLRQDEPHIWCAVPATGPVPRFLFSGEWRFGGQGPVQSAPGGFRGPEALHSEGLNGFYLFHAVPASPSLV